MDARDTSNFGWTNKQRRENKALCDLEVEIVTRNPADFGPVREGLATTMTHRIATPDSIAVRVRNEVEGREVVFGIDGRPVEADGWKRAGAAEVGAFHAANALIDRWAKDSQPLTEIDLV
jgi:hypothetical protein